PREDHRVGRLLAARLLEMGLVVHTDAQDALRIRYDRKKFHIVKTIVRSLFPQTTGSHVIKYGQGSFQVRLRQPAGKIHDPLSAFCKHTVAGLAAMYKRYEFHQVSTSVIG